MTLYFDKHAAKGQLVLIQLSEELGCDADIDRSGRILRCVFHTLRNYLTLEENFQLLAQLPMALKGVYVDGWSPFKDRKNGRKKEDFISAVINNDGKSAWRDFSSLEEGEFAIRSVFSVLRKYVTEGEMEDIESVLPESIKDLLTVK